MRIMEDLLDPDPYGGPDYNQYGFTSMLLLAKDGFYDVTRSLHSPLVILVPSLTSVLDPYSIESGSSQKSQSGSGYRRT